MMPLSRKRTKYFILVLICIITAALGWSLWYEKYMQHPVPHTWSGFDVALPEGYAIHGIDVSHYQGRIDWASVKAMKDQDASLRFAFIKATEGVGNTDASFDGNWQQCHSWNLSRGAYHFFHPGLDPYLQALRFICTVQLSRGDLPPVLDAEVTEGLPPEAIRERICTWLNMAETWYHVKPVIYTNVRFYRENLESYFHEYPLWIAHYGVPYPHVADSWAFWQHSDHGHVNGIGTYVDLNTFYGDSTAFNALLVH